MKRKEFIKGVIGTSLLIGCEIDNKSNRTPQILDNNDLEPIDNDFDENKITILLRRATLGFNNKQKEICKKNGLHKTIDLLFEKTNNPSPPVNFEFTKDKYTPIGDTWVDKPYLKKTFFEQYRKKSIQSWIFKVIYEEPPISIREQMTLFWHNHFGVSDIVEHKYEYVHNNLLREYAFGNYKELVKKITIDPAMLRFLSGFENNRNAPNENYARELLELFTIGRGKQIADGNYTNYTEGDIKALSRALTGWQDVGHYAFYEHVPIGAKFNFLSHDPFPVKLSSALNYKVIPPIFHKRYEYIIDVIFSFNETARFICRKLYRWFVNWEINKEVESSIIEPLSQILIENNYELKPVLKKIFSSNFFYNYAQSSTKTKNPIEYIYSILKYFPFTTSGNIKNEYNFWHQIFLDSSSMAMEYFKPPSVAGWKAYYQAPMYYDYWINAATLNNKQLFCNKFFVNGFIHKDSIVKMDLKKWLLSNSYNLSLNKMIEDINRDLFKIPFNSQRISSIKEVFLNGTRDVEWEELAKKYMESEESNKELEKFEYDCRKGLKYIFSIPEFHLI